MYMIFFSANFCLVTFINTLKDVTELHTQTVRVHTHARTLSQPWQNESNIQENFRVLYFSNCMMHI